MSRRRSASPPSSPRPAKRAKLGHLTSDDFKDGIFLAPMVRSGALPTRLFALKHGATLVWGPEMVDKAILHAERVVDPETGVISYNGKSRAMFTTHPVEKPYLIYQIGSSDPDLAVKAAKTVMQDVSGIDLNCGCPKPFSTHAGMGAALLSTPDLLCSILTALREAMPPEISVSAKIRLLPTQEETLKLVERIANTGVSAITVHCRTRPMRDTQKALVERLREIVDFVNGLGKGIAVVENGDCLGYNDVKRVIDTTGAHSVMIARAAEANPSCFSPTPLSDIETDFLPSYIRLSQYLDNHWGLTKFCASQFKSTHTNITKAEGKRLKEAFIKGKKYSDVESIFGPWSGKEVLHDIIKSIEARPSRLRPLATLASNTSTATASLPADPSTPATLSSVTAASSRSSSSGASDQKPSDLLFSTPPGTQNPEPIGSGAPLFPTNEKLARERENWGHDAATPTPTTASAAPAPASA